MSAMLVRTNHDVGARFENPEAASAFTGVSFEMLHGEERRAYGLTQEELDEMHNFALVETLKYARQRMTLGVIKQSPDYPVVLTHRAATKETESGLALLGISVVYMAHTHSEYRGLLHVTKDATRDDAQWHMESYHALAPPESWLDRAV